MTIPFFQVDVTGNQGYLKVAYLTVLASDLASCTLLVEARRSDFSMALRRW